jgi:hypothetical protein
LAFLSSEGFEKVVDVIHPGYSFAEAVMFFRQKKYHRELKTVFTLNFLPYKPTAPVSSDIYRPTINSTGPNLKTTLIAIDNMILEFSED